MSTGHNGLVVGLGDAPGHVSIELQRTRFVSRDHSHCGHSLRVKMTVGDDRITSRPYGPQGRHRGTGTYRHESTRTGPGRRRHLHTRDDVTSGYVRVARPGPVREAGVPRNSGLTTSRTQRDFGTPPARKSKTESKHESTKTSCSRIKDPGQDPTSTPHYATLFATTQY